MDLAAQPTIVHPCIVYAGTGTRPLSLEYGQVMSLCGQVVPNNDIRSAPLAAEGEQTLNLSEGSNSYVVSLAGWEAYDDEGPPNSDR